MLALRVRGEGRAEPPVLFLDEPTTGIDPRGRSHLWGLITELVKEGTTVLLTTQYLDEADQLADRIVVIDHGRVIAAGTADELKQKVGGQIVEVWPLDPNDVPAAAKLLGELSGDDGSVHHDAQLVTAPIGDQALLTSAVRRLDEAGISLAQLALRPPSLDEVFLALTGHAAAGEIAEEEHERGAR